MKDKALNEVQLEDRWKWYKKYIKQQQELNRFEEKELDLELDKFLKRQELIFIAKHYPSGKEVEWLAPSCENLDDLINNLRWLGFKIKEVRDEEDDIPGERFQMVKTTSGVCIYVNTKHTKGFVT